MTAQVQAPPRQTMRVVHKAMAAGVVLYGLVAHFVILPTRRPGGGLIPLVPWLLGVSLASFALGILLSKRVPRPSTNESLDSFWKTAAPLALTAWAPLEGAELLGVVVYSQTGSVGAIAVAIISLVVFLLLNPTYFERR